MSIFNFVKNKNKVKFINKIISENIKNDNFIYIFAYSYFDKDGINYYSGGGERYVNDLSEIILSLGYKPVLIQKGNPFAKEAWSKNFNNMLVIGVNADEENYFNIIANLNSPKLAIYSGSDNWGIKAHHPSILLSHGITWDTPEENANLEKLQKNLNFADYIISVDTNTISWYRSTFPKLIKKNNIKMKYIPNYVDLDLFTPNLNKHSDYITIIYPRRCCEERGFWLIANVIPKVLQEFKNVKFNLVGYAHSKEIEDKIKKLKEQYPNNVYHSVVNAQEMVDQYQNADIAVVPTLYCEGTSLSCIEAMACGNAVITTDVGGLPNLVINNYNGVLTEPDETEIYEALQKVIINTEYRKRLQENALDVVKVFSKKEWTEKWEAILKRIL